MNETKVERAYDAARAQYAALGVDTAAAVRRLGKLSISLHCWQGDDLAGFESNGAAVSGGGLLATGNHPGRARTPQELRGDLDQVYKLIPGKHRLNLHAIYGEFGGRVVDRNEIGPEHFQGWVDWAKERELRLDFNATCFSHPKAAAGLTLSSPDPAVRAFWVEHVKRCRLIAAHMGRSLGDPCLHDLWIPDGSKEVPMDRRGHRARLLESLDAIYSVEYSRAELKDAVESKLFGLGSESFVVGSHEFYLGYALKKGLMVCLDLGHFHPTESVADKLSAVLAFSPELLLHLSRGVRWDSDHIVILNDELLAVAQAVVRDEFLDRVHLALDYFDASMNRIGAWVIGARATLKALLCALLEPLDRLREAEAAGDGFARLALLEEAKSLPFGAVWDWHCLQQGVPPGMDWLDSVRQYEQSILSRR